MLNLTSPVPDFGPRAACLGLDTELFFPIGEVGPSLPQIARAKDVCAGCPVMAECRAWALEFGPDGIWGGMTAGERLPLRRRARAAARAREAEAEAEPVAGVWEQHRIHIVGAMPELEDQWTGWVPLESKESPDRLDGCVWGAVELMPELAVKAAAQVMLVSGSGAA